ncbi:MAG: regulatory protein TetR [Actinomycetia bacterium]|nr:regulatory protein TetR [Actinomycetes bacterium]
MTDSELRAADGRVPGRRGRATRTRLLECTADMLATTSLRDLKVIDIAREASTSPATFYQYFPDVESAILVLAEEMAVDTTVMVDHVRQAEWKGRAGYESALVLTDRFIEFWEQYRPVLRVVELASGEGDRRFGKIRSKMLNSVTVALSDAIKVAQPKPKGDDPLDPTATAGVLVAMLANVASHRYGFEFWGIRTDDARRSMAHLIYWSVTGQRPPA